MSAAAWAIDATNWVHVLWHAFQSRQDIQAAVVREFRGRLAGIRERFSPAAVFCCWDSPVSFRRELSPNYKATRPRSDERLIALLETLSHGIADLAVSLSEDGFEADDCLATVAHRWTRSDGEQCVIVSPDKDLRQCLSSSRVTILRKVRMACGRVETDAKDCWYREADLWDEYSLSPAQWPDFLAMVGDTSDNVAGCPTIGEVTSAKILAKVGSLDAAIANLWACPCTDRQRQALRDWAPQAPVTRELVTLCRAVPMVVESI
jgi:DNA polymerase I